MGSLSSKKLNAAKLSRIIYLKTAIGKRIFGAKENGGCAKKLNTLLHPLNLEYGVSTMDVGTITLTCNAASPFYQALVFHCDLR